jgi:hypothetical protein
VIEIEIFPEETVGKLKELVFAKTGLPATSQALETNAGTVLKEPEYKLKDYGIDHKHVIYVNATKPKERRIIRIKVPGHEPRHSMVLIGSKNVSADGKDRLYIL